MVQDGAITQANDIRGHRPELAGGRALAIILVIVFHSGCPYLTGGFLGVEVFFVLSGFLITSILASEIQTAGAVSYRRFLVRRFLRLAPALWLLVGVYLAAASLGSIWRAHVVDA